MGKDKKDKKSKDNDTVYQCERCNGVSAKKGDICKPEDCKKAVEGVSVVFHEAAIPSVPKSVADPVGSHQANVDGTFNMLMAAKEAGVKRFVYAASSSAYGDT